MGDSSLFESARRRAMAICACREYCIDDIRNKLGSWGVGEADTEKIIILLLKEKFIDEERYASAFARDKFKYNNMALESIDNTTYLNMIRDLLITHRRTIRASNQYDLKAKLLRYGLSKGFESHILYEMINDTDFLMRD
jgi:regulatory protein